MTGYHGAMTAETIEGPFLRIARRYSLCDDDAWEALARGFEIAMRHRERIRPDTATAWFATVVRHEALRIRRHRSRDACLDPAVHDPPADEPESERDPDPRLPALQAAMRQLKPDERRALILFYAMDAGRGDGGRYRRIAQLSRGVCVNLAIASCSDVDDMSPTEAVDGASRS